jgi:hypothetical protein
MRTIAFVAAESSALLVAVAMFIRIRSFKPVCQSVWQRLEQYGKRTNSKN